MILLSCVVLVCLTLSFCAYLVSDAMRYRAWAEWCISQNARVPKNHQADGK